MTIPAKPAAADISPLPALVTTPIPKGEVSPVVTYHTTPCHATPYHTISNYTRSNKKNTKQHILNSITADRNTISSIDQVLQNCAVLVKSGFSLSASKHVPARMTRSPKRQAWRLKPRTKWPSSSSPPRCYRLPSRRGNPVTWKV